MLARLVLLGLVLTSLPASLAVKEEPEYAPSLLLPVSPLGNTFNDEVPPSKSTWHRDPTDTRSPPTQQPLMGTQGVSWGPNRGALLTDYNPFRPDHTDPRPEMGTLLGHAPAAVPLVLLEKRSAPAADASNGHTTNADGSAVDMSGNSEHAESAAQEGPPTFQVRSGMAPPPGWASVFSIKSANNPTNKVNLPVADAINFEEVNTENQRPQMFMPPSANADIGQRDIFQLAPAPALIEMGAAGVKRAFRIGEEHDSCNNCKFV